MGRSQFSENGQSMDKCRHSVATKRNEDDSNLGGNMKRKRVEIT